MSLKWIVVTDRLKQGVQLINGLSTKKFHLLLSHIISQKEDDLFTEDELQKLRDSLKLSEDSVQLLIQSISHIFRQSSKVILKPTILYKQLCEILGFDAEKAQEFVKLWCDRTNEDFGDLSSRLKLENMSWELNVQVSDQINVKQSVPTARIQFELSKPTSTKDDNERVVMEFDQSELLQLYNNLEKIQVKLDNVNSMGN